MLVCFCMFIYLLLYFLLQLGKGSWRRPLTMGNQVSETHDRYNNSAGVRQKYHFDDAAGLGLPQPFMLHDHHVEGPSKVCTQLSPFKRLKVNSFVGEYYNL